MATAVLALSPDGKQVWVTGINGLGEIWFWELIGSGWVKRDIGMDRQTLPLLLDDGVWMVRRGGAFGYLKDGDILLGAGTGMRREWVRITP